MESTLHVDLSFVVRVGSGGDGQIYREAEQDIGLPPFEFEHPLGAIEQIASMIRLAHARASEVSRTAKEEAQPEASPVALL